MRNPKRGTRYNTSIRRIEFPKTTTCKDNLTIEFQTTNEQGQHIFRQQIFSQAYLMEKITNTYVAERIVRRASLSSKYLMSNDIASTTKSSSTTISPTHISLNQILLNNISVKQIARLASVASSPPRLLAGARRDCSTDKAVGPERHFALKLLKMHYRNKVCKSPPRLASVASSPPRLLAGAGRDYSTDVSVGPERHFVLKLLKFYNRNKVCKSQGWQALPPRILSSSPESAEIVRLICSRNLNIILF